MTDVLLVRPPAVFRNRPFPDGPRLEAPLGLLYLAAALDQAGIENRVFDALAHPTEAPPSRREPFVRFGAAPEQLASVVTDAAPRVVGINNPFTDHLPFALAFARIARAAAPRATIVVGGPHATADPRSVLEREPAIDAVVRGEGERAFPALVAAALEGRSFASLPGVVSRDAAGGLVEGPPFERIHDVDALPYPAYAKIDLEHLFALYERGYASKFAFGRPGSHRRMSLITSRGCPYTCSFCDAPQLAGHAFRAHSPEYVLDHVGFLQRTYGIRHLHLNDDNLTVKRARCLAILRGLRDRFPGLTWDTPNGVRADDLDDELVATAKQAGCTYLILGVESGDPEVLERVVKKRLSLDAVVRAARACQRVGLDVHAFYLLGLPGETPRAMHRTLAFAHDLLVRYGVVPHVNVVEPHVGTEVHAIAERDGLLTDPLASARDGRSIAAHTHPFAHITTRDFRAEELLELRDRFMAGVLRRLAWRAAALVLPRPRLALDTLRYFLGRWRRRPLEPAASLRATMLDRLLFPRALVAASLRPIAPTA